MRAVTAMLLISLSSAPSMASPVSDNWTCGASLSLSAMISSITNAEVAEAEKCASDYLAWATNYDATTPQVIEAVKARHVAFLAYARGLAVPSGLDLRALKTKLEEADARVEVEAQAAGLAQK